VLTRVVLFMLTNLAVLVVLTFVMGLLSAAGVVPAGGEEFVGLIIFASLFGFGGAFISLALSKWVAKRATGAQVITAPRSSAEVWLVERVTALSAQAGIGTPEVAVYPSPDPNAFATGARRNAALVAVSQGLMDSMSRDEVEGVLAHEVAHVANGDMVTMTLLQGVLNTFVIVFSRIFGSIIDNALRGNRGGERGYGRGPGYWLATIFAEIVLGILATVVVMWFSRWREFRADAGAARLAGTDKMVAALERLRRLQGGGNLPPSIQAFGIRGVMGGLFRSHPPLEDRIDRLRGLM